MRLLVPLSLMLGLSSAQAQYTCEVLPLPAGYTSRPQAIYAGTVVGTAYPPGGNQRACVWEGPAHTFRLLSNEQSGGSAVTSGAQGGNLGYGADAAIWLDHSRRGYSIHPRGYTGSYLMGMDGPSIVGMGTVIGPGGPRALLWQNRGSSVVDLHPPGFEMSAALAVSGQIQVGVAQKVYYMAESAAIWNGSAATMRFLPLPEVATMSKATAIRGNVIGGYFYGSNGRVPIIWNVNNLSYSLLPMPSELYGGEVGNGFVSGTNGSVHVGGFTALNYPFLSRDVGAAWVGNQTRFINLNSFLPPQYENVDCVVTGVDEQGNITGWIQSIHIGNLPVIWKPIKR